MSACPGGLVPRVREIKEGRTPDVCNDAGVGSRSGPRFGTSVYGEEVCRADEESVPVVTRPRSSCVRKTQPTRIVSFLS